MEICLSILKHQYQYQSITKGSFVWSSLHAAMKLKQHQTTSAITDPWEELVDKNAKHLVDCATYHNINNENENRDDAFCCHCCPIKSIL